MREEERRQEKKRIANELAEQTAQALADFVRAVPDPMLADIAQGFPAAWESIQHVAQKELQIRVAKIARRS